MQILLTNDDGFFAPGLAAMARALRKLGNVCIVAPDMEQSGVSRSFTFLHSLSAKEIYRNGNIWGYAVTGSPVDCVKLGIANLSPCRPDLIVSGLNNGLNAGANIVYSGTVGAAIEGACQGITSIAASVAYQQNIVDDDSFEKAADIVLYLIERLLDQVKTSGELFNINIPQEALSKKGIDLVAIAPVDQTSYWDCYEATGEPGSQIFYRLTGKPLFDSKCGNTDIEMVSNGHITITPLTPDSTKKEMIQEMNQWQFTTDLVEFDSMLKRESMGFRMVRKNVEEKNK